MMTLRGVGKDAPGRYDAPGHEAIVHVSLTDDHPWAQAFVVIEARPIALTLRQSAPSRSLDIFKEHMMADNIAKKTVAQF